MKKFSPTGTGAKGPIRKGLRGGSFLLPQVRDGIQALETEPRNQIEANFRTEFSESLDMDEAFRPGHESENRWDYLLGHSPTGNLIAVEPHSAKEEEIGVIIKKKRSCLDQLRPHLKEGVNVRDWIWLASGRVHFLSMDRARLRLDKSGITFVGGTLRRKDLSA